MAIDTDATFREGQLEAILKLVDDRGKALVVQRTGWGKSVVYFIATRLLRDRGAGPTILISPLLSLMRDQRLAAEALGVKAASIDSSNAEEWDETQRALEANEIDLLLISPERLGTDRFQTRTIASIERGIGLFVVDEAHCISDWGHDFRPDYQRIKRLVGLLPDGVPVLATTATANERVQSDIAEQLGPSLEVFRGPLSRESLHLQVVELAHQAERLAWLAEYLQTVERAGIVYTLTVRDARIVSRWLLSRGINAPDYHAQLGDQDLRPQLENALRDNQVDALVATVALGMGFDKPDLGFVVHFQRPGSVVAYYQQVGRAGRAIDRAEIVLLTGAEDDAIGDYFIANAFPTEDELLQVLLTIEQEELSIYGLQRELNMTKGTIERALKFLDIERAIVKTGGKWSRTVNPWQPNHERGSRITEQRIEEQQRMRDYVATDECLMVFLANELDDPVTEPCGRCANCTEPFASMEPDPELVMEAVHFLRHTHRPITPRKQWPAGLGGNIPEELQLCEGRALCVYGDAGWGQLVREGKFESGRFADELVEATAEMIDKWNPEHRPTWVTAVPSLRNPELVADFARRVAEELDLPYREALVKTAETPPQKTMENSYQQASNAKDTFAAVGDEVIAGEPVFLVDDMVDSKWSITVCGIALRETGSGEVYPVALAETTKSSDSS